jgi:1-acyl-sn-glycerol-3-phosphate acyltransferase
MVFTLPFLIVLYLLKLIAGQRLTEQYTHAVTRFWGRVTVLSTGSVVQVSGYENLTDSANVCFIANHQSLFDVPLLTGWLDRAVGFIAKKELKRIPLLNGWILAIHSAFIDRTNPRKAMESIKTSIENIRRGHALVIFPEGTRSKDCSLGEFKPGSLKLATNAQAVIQPISISGTRKIFESEHRIKKAVVTLIIHKPILPSHYADTDKSKLLQELRQIIGSSLCMNEVKES